MNSISIFCPVTGLNVNTGIETDWATYFQLRPFRMRVRCPQCGNRHEVEVRDGYLSRSESFASGRPLENAEIERLLARLLPI